LRKEYSDLSADQKMIYIKQNIISFAITLIPTFVFLGLFLSFITFTVSNIESIEAAHNLTKDTHDETLEYEIDVYDYFYSGFLAFGMLGILIGWIGFGVMIATYVTGKLGLYTDIDLEEKQKQLDEIKRKLEKK